MTTLSDPIRAKIRELRGYLRHLYALDGVSRTVTVALVAATAAVLLDWLLHLPDFVRLVLLMAAIAATGFVLLKRLVRPLSAGMNEEDLAVSVEARYPDLRDRLISTVEFTRGTDKAYFGSPEMVDLVIAETHGIVDDLDFRGRVATRAIMRAAQVAALVFIAVAGVLVLSGEARTGAERFLMPFGDARWPQRTFVESLTPGNTRVPQGDDVTVQVAFRGKLPSKAWVDSRNAPDGRWDSRRLTALDGGAFFTVFRGVTESFEYRVRGGDAESGTFSLEALVRPRITSRTLKYDYRDYTRLDDTTLTGVGGAIRAPVGTEVVLVAETNKDIASLEVTLNDTATTTFLAKSKTRAREISGRLLLEMPGPKDRPSYRVRFTDADGLTSSGEPYTIRVEEDRPPSVRIDAPKERELSVTVAGAMPLKVVAEDSFGLQDGELRWRITRGGADGDEEARGLFKAESKYGENTRSAQITWDLVDLKLQVGDAVNYHAAARDFCDFPDLDKPNVGTSDVYRLNVLSVEDYLDEIERKQKTQVLKELELAADIQDKNIRTGEEIAEKLAKGEPLTDREIAKLLGAEMAQKQVSQRAQKAGGAAEGLRADLLNNRQGASEVSRELKTTVDKLDEMKAGNLPQAENDVSRARSAPDSERKDALDKAIETEKSVKKDLDAMVNRLRRWQSLSELRRRAEELLKQQMKLNGSTLDVYKEVFGRDPKAEETETLRNLGTVQRELKGELTTLLADMVESAAELASRAPDQARLLAHAQNEAKRADIEKIMLDAAGHLSEALLGRASDEQDRAEAGLKELVKNLSEATERDRAQRELAKKLAELGKQLDKALAAEKNIKGGTEGATGLQQMLQRIDKALSDVRQMQAGQGKNAKDMQNAMGQPGEAGMKDAEKEQRDLQTLAKKTEKDVKDIKDEAPKIAPEPAKDALGKAESNLGEASQNMGQAAQGMSQASQGQQGGPPQAQEGQQGAQQDLKNAEKNLEDAKKAVKDAFERELDRLEREQAKNKELADRIREELKKLDKENQSKNLQNAQQNTGKASQNMEKAGDQMSQAQQGSQAGQGGKQKGKMEGAEQEEQEAIDNLQQARQDVQREQDQFEDNDLEETLLQIENELKKMLARQLEVNEGTLALDKIIALGREMTRKEEQDLSNTTAGERHVAEKAQEVKKTLEDEKIPVFAWAVGEVARDTNAIVARISRKDTGVVTRKMQDTVVETLKDLIDALQRERRKREQQPPPPGGGGQPPPGGPERIVPPLAELKMIRIMHKRVSDETGTFDEMVKTGEVKKDDVEGRVRNLGEKEQHIGKLLKDLMDVLSEQQQ